MIATQGPLNNTIEHFWRMVEQHNISVIFMLCLLEENNRVQCSRYWPDVVGPTNSLELADFRVELQSKI